MTLNKQQKVIIGVFGLALLGLLYDRVVLLPKSAGADPTEDANSRRTGLILAVNTTIPGESTTDMGLKERLNERLPAETLDVNHVRDAFTPSSDWLAGGGPNGSTPATEDVEFKKKYRLQAIMFQGAVQVVFMNGEIIRKGDMVDGYELVELTETSATFALDGIRTVLLLDG